MTHAADRNQQHLDQIRPCGIPRAMALEIMRDQELKELQDELPVWELDADRGNEDARRNVQAIKDRINELMPPGAD